MIEYQITPEHYEYSTNTNSRILRIYEELLENPLI
jgi:hypothetical protein